MASCNHRYEKFNEHQLFCRRCGEIKNVAPSNYWYWRPYHPYIDPHPWPYVRPYYPYVTWDTTSGTSWTFNTETYPTTNSTSTWIEAVTKDTNPETPKTPTEKKIKGVADPDVKK